MAVKPVIIPLVADTTGLEPGINALEALGKVDSDTANQFRAANKAFQDRGKVLDQSVTSTEKFAAASKKLVESIAGGAIAQATANIKKLTEQVDSTNAEFITLTKTIGLAKQELAKLQQGTPAFEKLSQEIQAAEMAMGNFANEAKSSRGQLRQYREALGQLEEAGLENTRVFQDMAATAGQLDDQIGDTQARIKALASDTFQLDASIQIIQGVAGAFSVAQGAVALFGDESEEVQQALLRVNAAMSILNGLQQLQNILQRQSTATLFVENALRRISAASIALQSLAESRFTVVRVLATGAQNALNAAMAANPAGVLLLAISAAAGALLLFANNSETAADAQHALADQQHRVIDALNEEIELQQRLRNTRQGGLTSLRAEIAEMQARGAARSEILALERRAISEEIENARVRRETFRGVAGAEKEFDEANEEILKLQQERRIKSIEQQKAAAEEGLEISKKRMEDEKKATQAFLRDQVAANEAAVIEARDGFERLVAQIALINAKLRQELSNGDLGPNERLAAELRAGEEIKKARQELLGDLEKLQLDHNTRITQVERERIQQSITLAQEELERKRQNAEEQKKIAEDRIEREKQLEQRRVEFSIQTASSLAGSLTEIYRNNADAQIAIEQQRLEQGLITQEQFDQKSRAIRRRAAQQEKEMALFQAALAQSLAILSILKDQTIPAPSKPLFIALASAQAFAQLAAIASKPIPQFAKGTKSAPGGPSIIGEAGPELFYANGKWGYANQATLLNLPKGAKVIPTLETEAILQKYNIPMPNIAANISTTAGGMKIDYNKLGSVIGREIGKLPLQFNSWDERGFSSYQTSISNRASHLRTKFRSPGK
jgi:hypothetical protein